MRNDPAIDFTWNDAAPDPVIGSDAYIVRWKKAVELQSGTYRFTARADDGIRVFLNENVILDGWKDQPATTYEVDVAVDSGIQQIRIEYYERTGGAVAIAAYEQLSSASDPDPSSTPTPTPTPTTSSGFTGEYWNLSGSFTSPSIPDRAADLIRQDEVINFIWNDGSPDPSINPDGFVIRWTANEFFIAGNHAFTLRSDDGVRFYIDGVLIIDDWIDHGLYTHTPSVELTEGVHELRLEYYENAGGALAILEW
jgi:hypothetical protein